MRKVGSVYVIFNFDKNKKQVLLYGNIEFVMFCFIYV